MQNGFTLLEIMIAMLLIALLGSFSLDFWPQRRAKIILESCAISLADYLAQVQSRARAVNENYRILLNSDQGVWFLQAVSAKSETILIAQPFTQCASQIDLESYQPKNQLHFYGRNDMSNGGHFLLRSSVGNVKIIVSSLGRIRLEWSA